MAIKSAAGKASLARAVARYKASKTSKSTSGGSSSSGASDQLKALSIALAKGAPVPGGTKQDVFDSSGSRTGATRDVGGQVVSRPSPTLDPSVKPYDGPVPYTGQGNPTPPAWATEPQAKQQAAVQSFAQPSRAESYYQQLLSFLSPSKEETDVQKQQAEREKQLRNLETGQMQAERNIADQPIAKPFVTGQQAAVAQQYGIDRNVIGNQMQTLQQRLANLQSRRQSALDVAKTGYEYGKYQDQLARQQQQDQLTERKYQDQLAQQEYENQLAMQKLTQQTVPKTVTSRTSSGVTSAPRNIPEGGYDSSGGMNFITAKSNDVKEKVQEMFAPEFTTKLFLDLTDEQLRLFLNDYTTQQNMSQMSIIPENYLNDWKAAAGIGGSKSSSRSI